MYLFLDMYVHAGSGCVTMEPRAPQGEECRVAGTPALLQLVHGRLVLGAVTLHHDTLLTGARGCVEGVLRCVEVC